MNRLTLSIASLLCLLLASTNLWSQMANTSGGTLDFNNSSASGSAPFSATINHPDPVEVTVSSNSAYLPFVLFEASSLSVGNMIFPGARQIDIGPTLAVILDGYSGPFTPFLGNTGPSSSQTITVPVAMGSVATGSVVGAYQAVVIDPAAGPSLTVFTAATDLMFQNNMGNNAKPIANAGFSKFADANTCVTLDGSGSSDPEAASLTYSWTQVDGTTVTLDDSTAQMPKFIAPSTGQPLAFELVVNDGTQNSATATVIIWVENQTTTVSFTTDIVGSALSTCQGCHTAQFGTPSGNMDLDPVSNANVYSTLMTAVGDTVTFPTAPNRAEACLPTTSPIILKPLDTSIGGVTHGGGNIFTSTADTRYIAITTWLLEGAQNN